MIDDDGGMVRQRVPEDTRGSLVCVTRNWHQSKSGIVLFLICIEGLHAYNCIINWEYTVFTSSRVSLISIKNKESHKAVESILWSQTIDDSCSAAG